MGKRKDKLPNENKVKRNNRRAKKKGKKGNLTVKGYNKNVEFYGGGCCYCDKEGNTLEHLDPLFLDGNTEQNNCVPCCAECNNEKDAQDLWEYIDQYDIEEWRIACIEAIRNLTDDKFTVVVTAEEFREMYEEEL